MLELAGDLLRLTGDGTRQMLRRMEYKGLLATDTTIPGERKCDGITPAHGNGAIQVSRTRWLLFSSTLDLSGWDAVRSILYQLRTDAPNGPALKEGPSASSLSHPRVRKAKEHR